MGRLRLVDDAVAISANEAKVLIAAEFERAAWAPSEVAPSYGAAMSSDDGAV